MRNTEDIRQQSVITTPEDGFKRFEAKMVAYLIDVEEALRKLQVWDVKLEAEVTVDYIGNRSLWVHPMRQEIKDGKLQPWKRIEMDPYVAAGSYCAFNGIGAAYTPERTARSVKTHLDHYTIDAKKAGQQA